MDMQWFRNFGDDYWIEILRSYNFSEVKIQAYIQDLQLCAMCVIFKRGLSLWIWL